MSAPYYLGLICVYCLALSSNVEGYASLARPVDANITICTELRRRCEQCEGRDYAGDPDGLLPTLAVRCREQLKELKLTRCDVLEFHCRSIHYCAGFCCYYLAHIVKNRSRLL